LHGWTLDPQGVALEEKGGGMQQVDDLGH